MSKTYNKNNIGTALMNKQDGAIALLDIKRELERFSDQLAEAFDEASRGKIGKLKKVAANIELFRVVKMFVAAMNDGDFRMMEYYGGIIRDQYTDKPKVALHTTGDGSAFQGIVVLPPVRSSEDGAR